MSNRASKRSRRGTSDLVYSTETGRICPRCEMPQASCLCNAGRHVNRGDTGTASDGIVRLHHERKGRKGKGVTLVKGLELSDAEIAGLAKRLKSGCGVGGTVKAGVIELQTSEREKIKVLLEAAGFTVKIAGG